MNSNKKILTALVVLLLIANVATIGLFWFKKENKPQQLKGGPAKFIIKELELNKSQQEQYLVLVEEHQQGVRPLRDEIKDAKDAFFSLLSQPNVTEAEKQTAAKMVSVSTEKLDLLTFNHFAKVRAICNPTQQKKFDAIIKQVMQMMGEQHPKGRGPHQGPPMDGPPHNGPPPHERPEGELLPPPQN
ncbi:periplasmic heavy metal sensor [Pedobacter frigiditerrae]|uniref:Periplasmic heavy metal sensor n=1 Tax=Pedobacter frigiditerrae TaxID=2530452 RepID=A0A4R0MRE4_9SPHI|nr:periplasmic heavy metal sensor [Pedobacter frigiditerrae]TCC89460.1 periplasmic heavy metal sensor [Pedobacter frigiditerrae]